MTFQIFAKIKFIWGKEGGEYFFTNYFVLPQYFFSSDRRHRLHCHHFRRCCWMPHHCSSDITTISFLFLFIAEDRNILHKWEKYQFKLWINWWELITFYLKGVIVNKLCFILNCCQILIFQKYVMWMIQIYTAPILKLFNQESIFM